MLLQSSRNGYFVRITGRDNKGNQEAVLIMNNTIIDPLNNPSAKLIHILPLYDAPYCFLTYLEESASASASSEPARNFQTYCWSPYETPEPLPKNVSIFTAPMNLKRGRAAWGCFLPRKNEVIDTLCQWRPNTRELKPFSFPVQEARNIQFHPKERPSDPNKQLLTFDLGEEQHHWIYWKDRWLFLGKFAAGCPVVPDTLSSDENSFSYFIRLPGKREKIRRWWLFIFSPTTGFQYKAQNLESILLKAGVDLNRYAATHVSPLLFQHCSRESTILQSTIK
jgi:hypothetical protein